MPSSYIQGSKQHKHSPPAWGRCSAVLFSDVMLSEARCTKERSSSPKALMLAFNCDLDDMTLLHSLTCCLSPAAEDGAQAAQQLLNTLCGACNNRSDRDMYMSGLYAAPTFAASPCRNQSENAVFEKQWFTQTLQETIPGRDQRSSWLTACVITPCIRLYSV